MRRCKALERAHYRQKRTDLDSIYTHRVKRQGRDALGNWKPIARFNRRGKMTIFYRMMPNMKRHYGVRLKVRREVREMKQGTVKDTAR